MSQDPLEMPEKPKKKFSVSSVLVLILLVLVVGGGAFYFLAPGDVTAPILQDAGNIASGIVSDTPLGQLLPDNSTARNGQNQPGANPNATGTLSANPPNMAGADGPGVPDVPGALPSALADPTGAALPQTNVSPSVQGTQGQAGQTSTAQTGGRNNGFTLEPPADGVPQTPPPPPLPGLNRHQGNMEAIDAALAEAGNPSSSALNGPLYSGNLNFDSIPDDAGSPQDSIITPIFIRDFARYLVSSYNPKNNSSHATLIGTNQRYGLGMQGLRYAGDLAEGRSSVLNYAYSPGMIQALSQLYSDPFLGAMVDATLAPASGAPLSPADATRMFQYYAGEARLIAGSLRTVAATPELESKVHVYQRASQNLARTKSQFTQLQLAYENARDNGEETTALRAKMEDATRQSQSAATDFEKERQNLLQTLKQYKQGNITNDATLLYLAEWVTRRGASAQQATLAAAQALDSIAAMFDAEAGQIR